MIWTREQFLALPAGIQQQIIAALRAQGGWPVIHVLLGSQAADAAPDPLCPFVQGAKRNSKPFASTAEVPIAPDLFNVACRGAFVALILRFAAKHFPSDFGSRSWSITADRAFPLRSRCECKLLCFSPYLTLWLNADLCLGSVWARLPHSVTSKLRVTAAAVRLSQVTCISEDHFEELTGWPLEDFMDLEHDLGCDALEAIPVL